MNVLCIYIYVLNYVMYLLCMFMFYVWFMYLMYVCDYVVCLYVRFLCTGMCDLRLFTRFKNVGVYVCTRVYACVYVSTCVYVFVYYVHILLYVNMHTGINVCSCLKFYLFPLL